MKSYILLSFIICPQIKGMDDHELHSKATQGMNPLYAAINHPRNGDAFFRMYADEIDDIEKLKAEENARIRAVSLIPNTQEECTLVSKIGEPYRFGHIILKDPTEEDQAAIESFKKEGKFKHFESYVTHRVLIATIALQLDPKKDGRLMNKLFAPAIRYQDYRLAELLLQRGTDPNVPCGDADQSFLPLFKSESEPMAFLLTTYGASFTNVDRFGNTILHHVCWEDETPHEVVQYFLKAAKAIINIQKSDGSSALGLWCHYRCKRCDEKKLPQLQQELALFVESNADLNLKNKKDESPLNILQKTHATARPSHQHYLSILITQLKGYTDRS